MPNLYLIYKVALFGALLCANSQANDAVEEIVVAAEKLKRTTFETGASAAIVTQDDIAITAVGSVSEAFATVPNVVINPTNNDIIVRGIPRSGFGGAIGTTVYFMGGGPYLAFPRYTTVPIWDLRQIEVLRGPPSTDENHGSSFLRNAIACSMTRLHSGPRSCPGSENIIVYIFF